MKQIQTQYLKMKPVILSALLVLSTLLVACEKALKNNEDYAPKVEMLTAKVQDDGSILFTGSFSSIGKTKGAFIDLAGFCYTSDTTKIPTLEDRQIQGQVVGDNIKARCEPGFLSPDSTYVVSVWLTNGKRYTVSKPINIKKLKYFVTPPCTLTTGTFSFNGIDEVLSYTDEYVNIEGYNLLFYSNTKPCEIRFIFENQPAIGIYSTSTTASTADKTVRVIYTYNGQPYYETVFKSGSNVYVNKNSGVYEITVCSADVITEEGLETMTLKGELK